MFADEFSWSCSDCGVTPCYWLLSVAHLELLSGFRSYLVTRTVSTYSCLYRSYSSWKACASVTKVNFINQKLTFTPPHTLYFVFVRFLVKSKLIQMQSQNCDLWSYWSWKKCLVFGLRCSSRSQKQLVHTKKHGLLPTLIVNNILCAFSF